MVRGRPDPVSGSTWVLGLLGAPMSQGTGLTSVLGGWESGETPGGRGSSRRPFYDELFVRGHRGRDRDTIAPPHVSAAPPAGLDPSPSTSRPSTPNVSAVPPRTSPPSPPQVSVVPVLVYRRRRPRGCRSGTTALPAPPEPRDRKSPPRRTPRGGPGGPHTCLCLRHDPPGPFVRRVDRGGSREGVDGTRPDPSTRD